MSKRYERLVRLVGVELLYVSSPSQVKNAAFVALVVCSEKWSMISLRSWACRPNLLARM